MRGAQNKALRFYSVSKLTGEHKRWLNVVGCGQLVHWKWVFVEPVGMSLGAVLPPTYPA